MNSYLEASRRAYFIGALIIVAIGFILAISKPVSSESQAPLETPIYLGISGKIVDKAGDTVTILPKLTYLIYEQTEEEKRVTYSLIKLDVYDGDTLVTSLGSSKCPYTYYKGVMYFMCRLRLRTNTSYILHGLFSAINSTRKTFDFVLYVSPKGRLLLTIPKTIHLDGYETHYKRLLEVLENALRALEEVTPNASTLNKSIGIAFSIHPAAMALEYADVFVYGGDPKWWKKVFDNGYYLPPPENLTNVTELNLHRIALGTVLHEISHLVTPSLGSIEEPITLYYELLSFTFPSYRGQSYEKLFILELQLIYLDWASIIAGYPRTKMSFHGALYWVIAATLLDLSYPLQAYIDEGLLPSYADNIPELLSTSQIISNALRVERLLRQLSSSNTSLINTSLAYSSGGLASLFAIVPPEYRAILYMIYKERVAPQASIEGIKRIMEKLDEIYYIGVLLSNASYADVKVSKPRNGVATLTQTYGGEESIWVKVVLGTDKPILYSLVPLNTSMKPARLVFKIYATTSVVPPQLVVSQGGIEFYSNISSSTMCIFNITVREATKRYHSYVFRFDPDSRKITLLPSKLDPWASMITFVDGNCGRHAIYFYVIVDSSMTVTTTYTETITLTHSTTETITETKTYTIKSTTTSYKTTTITYIMTSKTTITRWFTKTFTSTRIKENPPVTITVPYTSTITLETTKEKTVTIQRNSYETLGSLLISGIVVGLALGYMLSRKK